MRSRRNKQTMNETKEHIEAIPTISKEEICADFLSVAGTVIAAGVYTVAMQFFNTHPEKGRDSVKLTALSTVIPETPRTRREVNF